VKPFTFSFLIWISPIEVLNMPNFEVDFAAVVVVEAPDMQSALEEATEELAKKLSVKAFNMGAFKEVHIAEDPDDDDDGDGDEDPPDDFPGRVPKKKPAMTVRIER
jgi:hypothetical protein